MYIVAAIFLFVIFGVLGTIIYEAIKSLINLFSKKTQKEE